MSAAAEVVLDDDALLAGFAACALESFHHADHVRAAWLLLRRLPHDEALAQFIAGLRRLAAAAGKPEKYDDALTKRYMSRISERMRGEDTFAEFAAGNPELMVWRGR